LPLAVLEVIDHSQNTGETNKTTQYAPFLKVSTGEAKRAEIGSACVLGRTRVLNQSFEEFSSPKLQVNEVSMSSCGVELFFKDPESFWWLMLMQMYWID